MALSRILGVVLTFVCLTHYTYGYDSVLNISISDTFLIPISSESDFGGGLNRDWIEGYRSTNAAYFRLYMAVYNEKSYPEYKDIWQDKSGNVVISAKGNVLWIGFGRPARQIEFAEGYLEQGKKRHEHNKPVIRSILVDAEAIKALSERAIPEKFISRGMDINVDQSKSPNQFGLCPVSTEVLRQGALSHSLVTYYLVDDKNKQPAWGMVNNVDALKHRVRNLDLNRKIKNKQGDWYPEKLFEIKTDIISKNKGFDIKKSEDQSIIYKSYLVKRKVLLTLIDEVMNFFEKEGRGYEQLKTNFEKNVVKNRRITESFKLGEDLTAEALNAVEKSIIQNLNAFEPKNVDIALWRRFSGSINQVRYFVKYKGTEIKLGNPARIIKMWDNLFHGYRVYSAVDTAHNIPTFQLAQDTTDVALRMTTDHALPAVDVCNYIKVNFIGRNIRFLQLVSPLHEINTIFIYAKELTDCLVNNLPRYMGRRVDVTTVVIYGYDKHIYRFYPDAQVGWSERESGTILLFRQGVCQIRIKGIDRQVNQIIDEKLLQKENPALKRSIDEMIRDHLCGLVIVPQRYIKWPKRQMDETLRFESDFGQ